MAKNKVMRVDALSISNEIIRTAKTCGFENIESLFVPTADDGFYQFRVSVEHPCDRTSRLMVSGTAKITSEQSIGKVSEGLITGLVHQIDVIH